MRNSSGAISNAILLTLFSVSCAAPTAPLPVHAEAPRSAEPRAPATLAPPPKPADPLASWHDGAPKQAI